MPFCAHCGSQVADTSYRPCPACGNPTNGAPKPQLGPGGPSASVIVIIAVVLVVLAIPIAGILAAIAIPNLVTAKERSKQKRTIADIRTLAIAVENYAISRNTYPENLATLSDVPRSDGWNHELRYECIGEADNPCAGYVIASPGKDGVYEKESLRDYSEQSTSNFDCDIVFARGSFVQYPEGVRK